MNTIKKLNKRIVARNVGRIIAESKYSREEIAELLDVSPRVIYFWQTGERIPSTESLYMFSQLFEVSMESILV